MEIPQLVKTINLSRNKKILVIGDIILDKYIYGSVLRVSSGVKIPIVDEEKCVFSLGGAANIAANLAQFSEHIFLCGWIGNDWRGDLLSALISENKIAFVGERNANDSILK